MSILLQQYLLLAVAVVAAADYHAGEGGDVCGVDAGVLQFGCSYCCHQVQVETAGLQPAASAAVASSLTVPHVTCVNMVKEKDEAVAHSMEL